MKIAQELAGIGLIFGQTIWAYTVDPPTTAPSDTIQDCTNWAVATSSDTCDSIASSNFITVAQLDTYNPSLANGCNIIVGDSYCVEQNWGIPPVSSTSTSSTSTGNGVSTPMPIQTGMVANCNKFYLVQSGDGCQKIADANGISLSQFYAWNPAVGSTCSTLIADDYVCVGVVGSTSATATSTTTGNGVSTPTPIQTGMVSNCNKFYLVQSGDGCQKIADANGISLSNFYAWNPAVGNTCTTLIAGDYVCVGIIGGTATTMTTSTTTKGNGVSTPTPTQTGMATDCDGFYLVQSGDGCQKIADAYGISLANFYAWNPAVGNTCTTLLSGYYVCVHKIGGATPTTTTATKTTGNGISTPTPTQTGMVSNCNKFHQVVSGDTCYDIATAANIALSTFYSWNKGVGSNCETLYLGYYVCIGTT